MRILLFSNDLEEQDVMDKLFVYLYQFISQERTVQWIRKTELNLLPSEEASKNINMKFLRYLQIFYVKKKFRSEIARILSNFWIPISLDDDDDDESDEKNNKNDENNDKMEVADEQENVDVKVIKKEEENTDDDDEEIIEEPLNVEYLFVDLSASHELFIEEMLPILHEIEIEMKKLNPVAEMITIFSDQIFDAEILEGFEIVWNVQLHKL